MSIENQKREHSILSMLNGTQRMERWRLFRQRNPCSINVGLSCSCIVGVLRRILIAPLRSSSSSFLLCAAALIIVFAPPCSSSFLRRRTLHHFAPLRSSSSLSRPSRDHPHSPIARVRANLLCPVQRALILPLTLFIFIARRQGRVDCCAVALNSLSRRRGRAIPLSPRR